MTDTLFYIRKKFILVGGADHFWMIPGGRPRTDVVGWGEKTGEDLRRTELSSGGASCPRSKGAPRGWGIQAETGWFLVSGVIEGIQVSERGLEQMRNVSNLRRWASVSDRGRISVSRARWPSRCFCSNGETWRVRVLPAWEQEWPGMPRCFSLSILDSPLVRGGALSVGS